MINLIFCVDSYGLFGRKNTLPWSFKEDLKYFKDITTNFNKLNDDNNVIVMGYNTWISLKNKLPNRTNVVISSRIRPEDSSRIRPEDSSMIPYICSSSNSCQKELSKNKPDYIYKSFDIFMEECKKDKLFYNKNIFIIGGKKLFSYVIFKYNKFIKHVFMNVIQHSFPQFLDDVIFKIYIFNNLELSNLSSNSIYCLNNNDGKHYYIKFNKLVNKNYNINDIINFTNNINYNKNINHTNNNYNNEYTILEDIHNIPLRYCDDCNAIIKKPTPFLKKYKCLFC